MADCANPIIYVIRFSVHVTPIYSNQDMEPSASEKSPLFFIKPINSQGQGIAGRERLQDRGMLRIDRSDGDFVLTAFFNFLLLISLGDVILEFPSPVFLALDWRNNERSRVHCNVESKPLQYREIEWSSDDDAFNCNRVTLKQCLEQFMQSETLSQEEAWFCPKYVNSLQIVKMMTIFVSLIGLKLVKMMRCCVVLFFLRLVFSLQKKN